ncbi:hypothetical protein CICLE_v10017420mg [Citrus x clementina]|uniref:Uncharacterized protein n=1 Tax=Citrus clementina TaxID=85681 RepID=V4TH89_CITCL|nr:hypothetical protein CICLE_v10017420mg [Citrus x clementina]
MLVLHRAEVGKNKDFTCYHITHLSIDSLEMNTRNEMKQYLKKKMINIHSCRKFPVESYTLLLHARP